MSRLLLAHEQTSYACYCVAIEHDCYLECFEWIKIPFAAREVFERGTEKKTLADLIAIREKYHTACKCGCTCRKNYGKICPDPLCDKMSAGMPVWVYR